MEKIVKDLIKLDLHIHSIGTTSRKRTHKIDKF